MLQTFLNLPNLSMSVPLHFLDPVVLLVVDLSHYFLPFCNH